MRAWLQTCGLAAGLASMAPLTRVLLSAGVSRITRPGEMVDSYLGAPHDGVYALQQLARRVSVDGPPVLQHFGQLDALEPPQMLPAPRVPILDKERLSVARSARPARWFGGAQWRLQRQGGVFQLPLGRLPRTDGRHGRRHGGRGLDPATDRVMNLFAAGHLYGGFISFWTILEHLRVLQLPMALLPDYELIAEQIIEHQANTLVGVPPHLLALFTAQGERLRAWGG